MITKMLDSGTIDMLHDPRCEKGIIRDFYVDNIIELLSKPTPQELVAFPDRKESTLNFDDIKIIADKVVEKTSKLKLQF